MMPSSKVLRPSPLLFTQLIFTLSTFPLLLVYPLWLIPLHALPCASSARTLISPMVMYMLYWILLSPGLHVLLTLSLQISSLSRSPSGAVLLQHIMREKGKDQIDGITNYIYIEKFPTVLLLLATLTWNNKLQQVLGSTSSLVTTLWAWCPIGSGPASPPLSSAYTPTLSLMSGTLELMSDSPPAPTSSLLPSVMILKTQLLSPLLVSWHCGLQYLPH